MTLFAKSSRPVQMSESKPAAQTGPTLIDPKFFKHIGGGLPCGTWQAKPPVGTSALPVGTW
jgi:hypothetical protein